MCLLAVRKRSGVQIVRMLRMMFVGEALSQSVCRAIEVMVVVNCCCLRCWKQSETETLSRETVT